MIQKIMSTTIKMKRVYSFLRQSAACIVKEKVQISSAVENECYEKRWNRHVMLLIREPVTAAGSILTQD